MKSRSSPRVLPIALLVSLVLHAVLGAWWAMTGKDLQPKRTEELAALPIDIIHTEAPEPKEPIAPAEPPEQKPRPRKPPPQIVEATPPAPPQIVEATPPEPPQLVEATPPAPPQGAEKSREQPPAESDRPTLALGPDAVSSNGAGPAITVRPDALNPKFLSGVSPITDPVPDAGVIRVPTTEDDNFVAHLVRDDIARNKVKSGIAHSYYGELGKALRGAWDAERAVRDQGVEGWLNQSRKRGAEYLGLWMDRAKQYAQTGNPLDGPPDNKRGASAASTGTDLATASLDVRRQLKKEIRQDIRTSQRAEVRVVQDGTGRLLAVELIKPSEDEAIDRAALEDVRRAAEHLPVPPAEVVGNDDRLESVWTFELIVSISPPAPIVTFTFDEVLGFSDVRLPLDRRIYKRIALVAVY